MFTVLHSSAGAGKTHALVKQYLLKALRAKDPSAYRSILALTFTNKAAVEMRERVLNYLEALASTADLKHAQADMRDSVLKEAGITPDELRRRAQAMLGHMLHHWGQVAISTIDSFTRRVVMPFARDLQLDHELRMTTEEEHLRAQAVDLLLEEAGSDAALTEVLVATCEQLLEEEQTWNPGQPLRELAKQLGREDALEHLAALEEVSTAQFMRVKDELERRNVKFAVRMAGLGREALDAIVRTGVEEGDLYNAGRGIMSYFRGLSRLDEMPKYGAVLSKAMESGRWYGPKAPAEAKEAIQGISTILYEVVREVEDLRGGENAPGELPQYFVRKAILRDLLPTASLNAIDLRLEALKREEGVSFFSDLTRKVVAIVQDEPAPFLYERLGERYKHFLIDEFQDTSLMQWHALLPLVENALGQGGSVFLVGDAKQAIYRWRNGEARQFNRFPAVYRKDLLQRGDAVEQMLARNHVPVEPLAGNYRSGRAIIRFNNEVAGVLKQQLREGERFMYDRHEQEANLSMEGYVEVACYDPKDKAKDEGLAFTALMVKAVKDSLEDGFRLGDIAVLVRSRSQGATCSQRLAEEGWPVVSPEGFTLGSAPQVCAVVHVLAWLQRATDEHAAQAVQAMFLLDASSGAADPFAGNLRPKERMLRWVRENPGVHMRLPLVPLVCRIARALGRDPAEDVFMMGLVNEVHAFGKVYGDDLPGFLEHWERQGRKRSVGGNAGPDTIQVMTIHKAKGLQFPVVIVPEAGKAPGGGGRERIWIRPDPPIEGLPAALVGMSNYLLEAGVDEVMEEKNLRMLDQLDVLYVAITRPEQRLYLSVPGGGTGFLAKALREHLGLGPGQAWASGQRMRNEAAEMAADRAGGPAEPEPASGRASGEATPRQWQIRCDAPSDWDPADPDPYRSHGNALHAILARVHATGDLPKALSLEAPNWGLTEEAQAAIARHLQLLLARPELEPFFGEGLHVQTESTLLDEKGRALRPDRVVREGGEIRVLDIKTGRPDDRHNHQVAEYIRLLRAVEGKPVEGWLLYIRDGSLVPVGT